MFVILLVVDDQGVSQSNQGNMLCVKYKLLSISQLYCTDISLLFCRLTKKTKVFFLFLIFIPYFYVRYNNKYPQATQLNKFR